MVDDVAAGRAQAELSYASTRFWLTYRTFIIIVNVNANAHATYYVHSPALHYYIVALKGPSFCNWDVQTAKMVYTSVGSHQITRNRNHRSRLHSAFKMARQLMNPTTAVEKKQRHMDTAHRDVVSDRRRFQPLPRTYGGQCSANTYLSPDPPELASLGT